MSKIIYDTIDTPVITEKTTIMSEMGKYGFKVAPDATKASVKKAVEEIFSVTVEKVNIINTAGKVKRFRGVKGKQADVKKAIVTLKKGQEIDIAGGIK